MRTFAAFLTLCLLGACNDEHEPEVAELQDFERFDYVVRQDEGLPEYGVIDQSGPVVVVLGTDLDQTLSGHHMVPIAQLLAGAGFTVISLDLPSHHVGQDTYGIEGWRARMEAGETTLFIDFCAEVSRVLDALGAQSVGMVGISRGGYVASICTALDGRIRVLALLAPVTDLSRLREFDGATIDQNLFGLARFVPELSRRKVLVRIGRKDTRVGTDAAVRFAFAIGADLQVVKVNGHDVPEDGSTPRWMLAQQ